MTEPESSDQIAVYIDFDNILMSHYDDMFGRGSYRADTDRGQKFSTTTRQRLKDARVDLGAIIDFASSFGTVAVSRAYANWSTPVNSSYAQDTLHKSIDLVQLFPLTGTKNGGDIRLAVDVVDDIVRFGHITHVMVVAGDSDYVALAQRCKRFGRRVIGVGAGKSAHKHWRSACDEFRYYAMLPGLIDNPAAGEPNEPAEPEMIPSASIDPAALLTRAVALSVASTDAELLNPGTLKKQLQRLEPSFDERILGFANFTAFLKAQPDIVDVVKIDNAIRVRPAGMATAAPNDNAPTGEPAEAASPAAPAEDEEVLALRKFLTLPRSPALGAALEQASVQGMRILWEVVADNPRPTITAHKDLTGALVERGFAGTVARFAASQVLQTGLPVLVRDAELNQRPSEELSALDDDTLLGVLRDWTTDRIRNRCHPDPVSAQAVAAAIHGSPPPADVVAHAEAVLAQPGYPDMAQALQTWLVAPRLLWKIAEMIGSIRADLALGDAEQFGAVVVSAIFSNEARPPDSHDLAAAYRSLCDSGVFASRDGSIRNAVPGACQRDVTGAVLAMWARRLHSHGLLDARQMLHREAFYRLALTDRYRLDWRNWTQQVISSATATGGDSPAMAGPADDIQCGTHEVATLHPAQYPPSTRPV